jgi:5-methyltetrahydropteroyltriglutamate--homocysteine methyltransferase
VSSANLDDLAAVGGLPGKRLVAGVVNGRNIWVNDLAKSLSTLGTLLGLADRVDVSASSSLLHVPIDAALERDIEPQILRWLAFARQKTAETVTLAKGLAQGTGTIAGELASNRADLASRANSPITHNPAVRARAAAVTDADTRRSQPYGERAAAQRAHLGLPLLPTTTIGSFPQTTELRTARADLRTGRIDTAGYEERVKAEIQEVISFQEKTGLDVLVHGEAERNDMVQYFAEQLTGYLATQHGWVQSYGPRYVRPPILVGDITRPEPMTVRWTTYAQSLTDRPVKGMLTGPVTMLAWSFVRDDQPLGDTARQAALALRDEVNDLEAAGSSVIQVDEPALRETLPLRTAGRPTWRGPRRRSGSAPAGCARTRRSTRTCATPSSGTSSRPSTTWTPTSSAWRPPAPTCRWPANSPRTATRARRDPACTTSTPHASPARRRPPNCCGPD